jgi:hypothetical protein
MTFGETRGVDALLDRARAGVRRLDPFETREAVAGGALLVDTRTGGVEAWLAAGLPVTEGPADVRR